MSNAASPDVFQSLMDEALIEITWPKDPRAQICRLHIIRKGKSLAQGKWLWRPIAVYPRLPLISNIYAQPLGHIRLFSSTWLMRSFVRFKYFISTVQHSGTVR